MSHHLAHPAGPGVPFNKSPWGDDTLSSACVPRLWAPRNWKPRGEEGRVVREGSRGHSRARLPGSHTPSLTNPGKWVPPGSAACLHGSYLPAWPPESAPCFRKDRVCWGAMPKGTSVTIAGHVSAGGGEAGSGG